MRKQRHMREIYKKRVGLFGRAPIVLGIIALIGCESSTGPGLDPAVWDSSLPVWASVEEAGFSRLGMDEVASYVETLESTGVVVLVGGRMLHFQGDVREASIVASVRKSILSIIYGRYVADGTIDLEATLTDLGIDDEGGLLPIEKQATVRDLLTARSGIYHPAANPGDDTQFAPPRGSKEPGTYFLYNNWDFNASGTVFELTTGKNIYDALRDDLAVPLGMEDFDRDQNIKSGNLTASRHPTYHMWLSTRDMARIGELVLRKGSWNGAQIVPSDWIEMSTSAITPLEEMNPDSRRDGKVGFGMMWWVWDGPEAVGAFEGALTASGFRGQYITVLPALDMVVAHKNSFPFGQGIRFAQYRGLLERLVAAATQPVGGAA